MEETDKTIHKNFLGEWKRSSDQIAKQAIKILEELAISVDPVKLFEAVVAKLCIHPADQYSDAAYGGISKKIEILSYHLYPYFGLSSGRQINPWDVNVCIDALEKLFGSSLISSRLASRERSREGDFFLDELRIQAEFVRGSAFPEQTAEEIVLVQGRHEFWFTNKVGIGPSRTQSILQAIVRNQEKRIVGALPIVRDRAAALAERYQNAKRMIPNMRSSDDHRLLQTFKKRSHAWSFGYVQKLSDIAPDLLPVGREELKDLDPPPTPEEWTTLIRLIGLTTENRKEIDEVSEIRLRPLYVLPDNRVVIADISNAMDVLWDKFEEVARQDEAFFQETYQKAKAKWLEEKMASHLANIFSRSHIYRNLIYPDPDKCGGATAELDAAVQWGPFLVLAEAKARQFRLDEGAFDPGRLRTDIKGNVEDAFQQAKRAARYISEVSEAEFTEKESDLKLLVSREKLRRIYLITVSQHHLAGLATRLATLQQLNLFKDGEYPFSISVGDLEVISQFCDGPDVFLHYIEKTLQIQKTQGIEFRTDDLDLFGAYLDTRLQASKIWKGRGKTFNFVWLSGWADRFHAWMMYKRGDLDKPPEIRLKVPEEIEEILVELRRRGDDSAAWVAFALLDMSDKGLNAIVQAVREIRSQQITPGMFRRLAILVDEVVIVVIGSRDLPAPLLRDRTHLRLILEKYRRKASKGIGLGIMLTDSSKPFECAAWVEEPWRHDEKIEQLLKSDPPSIPAPGQKLPRVNDPCLCGSGKKFKKCCYPKIPRKK